MTWAHPEGKNGTHRDYARRGAKKQMPAAKARKREDPAKRYERQLRELREAGL
ncbi:MAG: hypothetical protein ACOC8P_00415 [Dichotomicrobium sp.]